MGRSPFRSIFIPSILAAGATFAAVTLPLSLNQSVPRWVALGALQRQDIPVPEQSTKPVIRFIGLSIVASVAAGVATAELLRRWQAHPRNMAANQAFTAYDSDAMEVRTSSPEALFPQASRVDAVEVAAVEGGRLESEVSFDDLLSQAELHQADTALLTTLQGAPEVASLTPMTGLPDGLSVSLKFESATSSPVIGTARESHHSKTTVSASGDSSSVEQLLFPEQVLPLHVRVPLTEQVHPRTQAFDLAVPSKTDLLSPSERGTDLEPAVGERITFAISHRDGYYCLLWTARSRADVQHWLQALHHNNTAAGSASTVADYVVTQQGDLWVIWQRHPAAVPLEEVPANNLAVMPQRGSSSPAWLAS